MHMIDPLTKTSVPSEAALGSSLASIDYPQLLIAHGEDVFPD